MQWMRWCVTGAGGGGAVRSCTSVDRCHPLACGIDVDPHHLNPLSPHTSITPLLNPPLPAGARMHRHCVQSRDQDGRVLPRHAGSAGEGRQGI
jgi:hypothetical protein